MVFNESILKKLIKSAYNIGHFHMGKRDDRYILAGTWWFIEIDESNLSNKIKAAIIELTGLLPERGEFYECSKEDIQMEFPEVAVDVLDKAAGFLMPIEWEKTKILIEKASYITRIYQHPERKKTDIEGKIAVNELIVDLLKGKLIETDDPNINGPGVMKYGSKTNILIWKNRDWVLAVGATEMITQSSRLSGNLENEEKVYMEISRLDLIKGTNV